MQRVISVGLVASLGFSIVNGCSSPERSFNRDGASGSSGTAGASSGGTAGKSTSSGGHAGTHTGTDAGAAGMTEAGAGGVVDEPGGDGGRAQGGNAPVDTGGTTGTAGAGGKGTAGSTPTGGTGGSAAGSGGSAGLGGSGGGSGCATACASYQSCSSGKCLPTYASTRVLPRTDQTSGYGQVNSAVVLTNKAQGDIIVQFSDSSNELLLSDPGASMTTTLDGAGYAHYTADGKLVWFRPRANIAGSNISQESGLAFLPPSDFAVSFVKYEPPTGPTTGKSFFHLARVGGISGNVSWDAKYPTQTSSGGGRSLFVVPRPTQNDFLTFYPALSREVPGQSCQVVDNGTSASVTCPSSSSSFAIGAAPGADGNTAWIWGAPGNDGSWALNPLSTTTWPFKGNPYQYGGEDAFILGIRGASSTVGPWITEGDYGPVLGLAVLPQGDLAVTAEGYGLMTFNGGQSLFDKTGNLLFRLDVATGQILWRTPLTQHPTSVIAAPGGRIAVLFNGATSGPTSVQIFEGTTGALLSTLPFPPNLTQPVLAAGQTDLFVLGDYEAGFDFDPGTGTDMPSSTRGVYISRYTF